ncbi:hypothetical protein GWK47_031247 [Chionoecetes opilio]|uniref:Uncharacterized protein n=1 Tax=Chionoecetes opilio TaxID=41210 RepID=A0A8J5D276_CHIOP|nr:hypothetical protein GWK47_031247 [Chionoecetes opilio]
MDSGFSTSSCGSWPKLNCRSPQFEGLGGYGPQFCQGLRRDQGIGRDFVPRVLNRFLGEKRPPASEEEVDVLQRWLDLMTPDNDDSSSTISSPLASVDGYVRESFPSANRFFQLLVQTSHRTPPPLLPLGKKEFLVFRERSSE